MLTVVIDDRPQQDVACFQFSVQRHVPQISLCPILPFLYPSFLRQLFTIDEGQHALDVLLFLLRKVVQRCHCGFPLLTDIFVEEVGLLFILKQDVSMQLGQYRRKALTSHAYFLGYNLVTNGNSLTEQLLVVVDYQQALTGRIFGVKQADVHLVC